LIASSTNTLRPFHLAMLGLGGGGMLLASFNLMWLSFALPEVRELWSLDPLHLAVPPVAAALGGMLGSAVAGQLADRSGRRGVFQVAVAISACSTLLSAFAPGPGVFVLAQVGLGAGVNGLTPAATALVVEMSPAFARGRMTALLQSCWVVGMILSAAAAYLLIPVVGWRWGMATGGLALLYVWVVRRYVPESPRYLIAHGKVAEAFALKERLERRWDVSISLPMVEASLGTPITARSRMAELWSPLYRRRTVVLWAMWFVQVFTYRGVYTWLPTLLVLVGQAAPTARLSLLLISLAQLPATVGAAFAIDRAGRKPLLVGGLGVSSVAAMAFGLAAREPILAMAIGALMGASILATNAVSLVYTPELYPTRVRATGVGMASSFGRIAAVLAPGSVSALLVVFGGSLVPVFAMFAIGLAAGALIVGLGGEETAGRSLEHLSR
jgi:MFS transporter, putative metabolite:H+ symporter